MTITATGLPDAGSAIVSTRAAAQVATPIGVNDASALARQQLVTAVPAPVVVAAYTANVATPAKPVVRNPPAVSSSSFAAQFIAQTPGATQEDLELFTVRPTPPEPAAQEVVENDFLNPLPSLPEAVKAIPARIAAQPAKVTADAHVAPAPSPAATAAAPEITLRVAPLTLTTAGLVTVVPGFGKKPSLLTARGSDAYQLASVRQAALRRSAPITEDL